MTVWVFVAFAVAAVAGMSFVMLWRHNPPMKPGPALRRKKERHLDRIVDAVAERGERNSTAIAGELQLIKEQGETIIELTKDLHAHIVTTRADSHPEEQP